MLQDKVLTCLDCGQEFAFTASEQEFYAQKGFTNNPSRCGDCRKARKARQGEGSYSSGGGYARQNREMYPAVCATCGKETTVPFQPRGDRPVYCSDCFRPQRSTGGSSYGGGGGGRRSY